MIQVVVDQSQNVFKITFTQHVDRAQAKEYREKIGVLLAELQPGFRILVDLSQLEQMDLDCAPEVQAVMDMCQAKGVSRIVRVIPDPKKDIGFKLMSVFHYSRDVTIITCETLEDAVKKLAV